MREVGWGRNSETMANAAASALRKRLTPQEVKVWVRLRELRLSHNLHFRRQAPIGGLSSILKTDALESSLKSTAANMECWAAPLLMPSEILS
jgi:hypothetical protein